MGFYGCQEAERIHFAAETPDKFAYDPLDDFDIHALAPLDPVIELAHLRQAVLPEQPGGLGQDTFSILGRFFL